MQSGSETDVRIGLQKILDEISPSRFGCRERKSSGESAIGKPVDLEIYFAEQPQHVAIAVEVANVNTTQLVGETCRLYYDTCYLKLLILGDRNVPSSGREQSEHLLSKLYGQDEIRNTPARVAWYYEDDYVTTALKELLLL
jgi:hypothetical protein